MNLRELIDSIEGLAELDYDAIAAHLNARPQVPNPEPQQQVAKPLRSVDELFGIILAGSNFEQDMAALTTCAQFLAIGKVFGEYCSIPFTGPLIEVVGLLQLPIFNLSATTAIAVQSRLAETMPDPSWTETVAGESLAEQSGLGRVSSEQVQGAYN